MNASKRGFTIVELLIVIVVIAILAAITLVTFGTIQERTRMSRAQADLKSLDSAIRLAQINTGKALVQVTGTYNTRASCMQSGSTSRADLNSLPKTHACWTNYLSAVSAIETASGAQLSGLKQGSPWGGPYLIDENEGENGYPKSPCQNDDIGANDNATGKQRRVIPLARSVCVEGDSTYAITI